MMSPMVLLLLPSLASCLSASLRAEGEKLEVTGGGIVRRGDNVTLSLVVGEQWERCYWFRYGHLGNTKDFEHCSFELDPATNRTKLRKCDSEELRAMVSVVQGDGGSCAVRLEGMEESMEGKWAARLDTDLAAKEVELLMQVGPSKVSVSVGPQGATVSQSSTVVCAVTGGRPRPEVVFTLQRQDGVAVRQVDWTNMTAVEGAAGLVSHSATFLPEVGDLGASLACTVSQEDRAGAILLQETSLGALALQFPPQPLAPSTLQTEVGARATLTAELRCSPAPTSAVWTVQCRAERKDDIGCSRNLTAGTADQRFNVSMVEEAGASSYRISLTVLEVEEGQLGDLFSLTVTNTVGSQVYNFSLTAEPTTTTTTTTTTIATPQAHTDDKGSSGSSAPGVILALLLVVVLAVVGLLVYRRRKGSDSESAPLTSSSI